MQFFVLAHGALGIWDEVIFIGVGILFLVFMVISWVRSRAIPPHITQIHHPDPSQSDESHFRLD